MIKIVSIENMRKSDAFTIESGVSSRELMLRAGKGIYDSVEWWGDIAIICGKGNNGGDGYALATLLKESSFEPHVFMVEEPATPDAIYYYEECKKAGVKITLLERGTPLRKYNVIVDCIFGTGFKGAVLDPYKTAIEKINNTRAYVVSADINSGLNGDSGLCDIAVYSNLTVAIGEYKSGHYLAQAKDYIGELKRCDIGIEIQDKPYYLIEKSDTSSLLFKRMHYSHKGTYGYMALIGGSTEYSGAIKLANLSASAVSCGAGVVKLAVAETLARAVAPYLLESTLYTLEDYGSGHIRFNSGELELLCRHTRAIGVGMGIGHTDDTEKIVEYLLKNYKGKLLIDADGLNALSFMDLSLLKKAKCKVVLTPHLKEMERLCKKPAWEVEQNPVKVAKEFAKEYGVVLLLKGPTTIITDGEEVYFSDTGSSAMAKGGSGDVLSGIITAFLATTEKRSAIQSTYLGAYVNGLAGELAEISHSQITATPRDTVKYVPLAIEELLRSNL
ncbi:MAG: NAD(P)H-hydrate dehydratase [Clostridia bacterium]|nr:NAD(P)H-hydrate dehydratase [Clostridia bacterium]